MNIVLDIDGTLIDTISEEQHNAWKEHETYIPYDMEAKLKGKPVYIYKRAHLDEFIRYCLNNFDNVGIWTLGEPRWARFVIKKVLGKRLDDFHPVLSIQESTIVANPIYGWKYLKPLASIYENFPADYKEKRTLIIDDAPLNSIENRDNAFDIKTFEACNVSHDTVLLDMIDYLGSIKNTSDIRLVPKSLDQHMNQDEQGEDGCEDKGNVPLLMNEFVNKNKCILL